MLKVGDRLVCYQNKNTFDNGNDEYDINAKLKRLDNL